MVLNHLKIGPLRNSSFCFLCISTSLRSVNIDIPNKQNTTHSITTNPLVLNGLQIIKLNHDFWNTLFFKTPATFGPHFPPPWICCCKKLTLFQYYTIFCLLESLKLSVLQTKAPSQQKLKFHFSNFEWSRTKRTKYTNISILSLH